MDSFIDLRRLIASFEHSPLAPWSHLPPWELTAQVCEVVHTLMSSLGDEAFFLTGDMAIHRSAVIEPGATLKGPLIVGAHCFVANGAYLRGGNWIGEGCSLGPGTELKSSFLFANTKLAHFNFVGDSILGADVNLEAGSIICNYRNERAEHEILVRQGRALIRTGREKFGAVVGDHVRIGANAVIAPGAVLKSGAVVRRMELCDQEAATA